MLLTERLFWFLIPATVLIVVFLRTQRRVVVPIISLCLPVLWLDPWRALAQLAFLPFIAIPTVVAAFAGRADGETWSEGFVALSALGCWSAMWLGILFVAIWGDNRTIQATLNIRRQRRMFRAPDA